MKRLTFIVLLLLPCVGWGQYTTVTATVPQLVNASYIMDFVNLSGVVGKPLLGGISVFPTQVVGSFTSSGVFRVVLADNNQVFPLPSQWKLNVCVNVPTPPSPLCFNLQLTITGATQDITAQIVLAVPPALFGLIPVGTVVLTQPNATQTVTQPINTNFNFLTSGSGNLTHNSFNILDTSNGALLANTVQNNINTNQTVTMLNNVVDPIPYAGADLGTKINAAITALGAVPIVFRIPAGTYNWSALVTIDPRLISIEGSGSGNTIINCTVAACLKLFEPAFSLDPGGEISGFTLNGNGASNQVGIESAGVQSERWDDITFEGFTGTGATSWYLNNSNSTNGWQERIQATKIRVLNGFGLKFSYLTSNVAASSFGFSNFAVSCDGVPSGFTCFKVASGRLYGSNINIQGNVFSGGTLIDVAAGSFPGDMDENRYSIEAEPIVGGPVGACIHVETGAEMLGVGYVVCNGLNKTDDNALAYSPHLRIVPVETFSAANISGQFANWNSTGQPATSYMSSVFLVGNPDTQMGTIHGNTADAVYSSFNNLSTNGHFFYACPGAFADISACTLVGTMGATGVFNTTAGFAVGGTVGVTCSGAPTSSFATVKGVVTHC